MKTIIKKNNANNNPFNAFQQKAIDKQQATKIKGGIGTEDGVDI